MEEGSYVEAGRWMEEGCYGGSRGQGVMGVGRWPFCGGGPFPNLCHPRHIRGRGPQPVLEEHGAWEGPRSGGWGKACLRRKAKRRPAEGQAPASRRPCSGHKGQARVNKGQAPASRGPCSGHKGQAWVNKGQAPAKRRPAEGQQKAVQKAVQKASQQKVANQSKSKLVLETGRFLFISPGIRKAVRQTVF